jgi:CubicO group peptidase (beta-lactamase class C family)
VSLTIIAWHDRNVTNHQQMLEKYSAEGFRTISLCVYGERTGPRYAAVMIRRPFLIAQKQFHSLDAATWQQTFDDMAAQGWGPFIVTATGPANNPLIAAVFRLMNPIPLTRHGISADELKQINEQMIASGGVLQWADTYGTPEDTRYIAVWYPNNDNASWNCDALNDDLNTAQRRFEALVSGWARPVHIAVTPSNGILELYADNEVGPWVSRDGMTSSGYQAEFDNLMSQGFAPVRVAANGSGSNTQFAAIFATKEEVEPRTFRKTGSAAVLEIDEAIEQVMKINQVRGSSLAITKGSKLVYAKGYTWAEPNYPNILPTTLFRQASVSKMFTALAIYQLISENQLSLDTKMQDILQLTSPSGTGPIDSRFNMVTIRHLLEHTSGLDLSLIWRDLETAQAFNIQLPVTPNQLAMFCASEQLWATPGDNSAKQYNNTGYFMLSRVVARLRGTDSFESAITPTLLQPLGITRVLQSRTLVSAQVPQEARYHSRPLKTDISKMSSDLPMIPLGYGETNMENADGSGGLSGAATDVARILAALSLFENNPIVDENTLTTMLNNASANGGHGFDWVQTMDVAGRVYRGVKGGALSTSQNAIYFSTGGGLSYVICWNGQTPTGESWYPIFNSVINAAQNHEWGNIDLFPQYGMNPLAELTLLEMLPELHTSPIPKIELDPFRSPLRPPSGLDPIC